MCGIAGIMFKNGGGMESAGRDLIDMLDGCQHRGPDSTGFALYGDAVDGELLLRFFVGEGEEADRSIARIKGALHKHTARIVEDERVGSNYRVPASFDGDIQKLAYDVEHAAKVISIGSSLEIVKDVGSAHEVDDHYGVSGFHGTHGLGHVRLATESAVKPESARPFWATHFADVATAVDRFLVPTGGRAETTYTKAQPARMRSEACLDQGRVTCLESMRADLYGCSVVFTTVHQRTKRSIGGAGMRLGRTPT